MAISRDRISSLPDPILQYILFLIPLKSAIGTSILSKRWKHLWEYNLSSARSLEFGKEFAGRKSPEEFVAAVEQFMQLHDSKELESLHVLFFPFDIHLPTLERWITLAATKGVNQVDLGLFERYKVRRELNNSDRRTPFELPTSLFDCVSLTRLSLSCCRFRTPLHFRRFGSLLSLSLKDVNIDDAILHKILADCQLLESLSMTNCHRLQHVRISGLDLRLESLTMVDCLGVYFLDIGAPRLRSLHQYGRINFRHRFIEVSSLVDVFISSVGREGFGNYTRMLTDLAHVHVLTLCTATLQHVTGAVGYNPQEFALIRLPNLQELQLLIDVMNEEGLSNICTFLRFCPTPALEKLFIQLPRHREEIISVSSQSNAFERAENITFNFNNLKVIKLNHFRGSQSELILVKFLLQRAVSLQSLVSVAPPIDLKKEATDVDITSSSKCEPSERIGLKILRGQLSMILKASPNVHSIVCDEQLEEEAPLYEESEILVENADF